MRNYKVIILLIPFIFLSAMTLVAQNTIIVSAESDISTIQQAIERARPFDEIQVKAGVYSEIPILVDKPLTITGIDNPVLDAQGKGQIMLITADSVTVSGFHFKNTGFSHTKDIAALRSEANTHITIKNNIIHDSFFAIYLAQVDGAKVLNNRIIAHGSREATSGNGVHMWDSQNITVSDNHISGHRDGIYLEFADQATITGNVSENNIRYGLHYMFTKHSVYTGNTFRNNGAGVAVMYSHHVKMNDNIFADNWGAAAYGLLLKDISDSEISGNTFRQNTIAIYSEGSSNIRITKNLITNNGYAVKIMANSQDNVFEGNNFIENTFDVVTNSRRNFNTFQKNYWSRYDGYDLIGDGFGDIPYRPVRLYSVIVEQHPTALILLRSFFIDLLDIAEKVMPVLTPETLIDDQPLIKEIKL